MLPIHRTLQITSTIFIWPNDFVLYGSYRCYCINEHALSLMHVFEGINEQALSLMHVLGGRDKCTSAVFNACYFFGGVGGINVHALSLMHV